MIKGTFIFQCNGYEAEVEWTGYEVLERGDRDTPDIHIPIVDEVTITSVAYEDQVLMEYPPILDDVAREIAQEKADDFEYGYV